MTNDNALGRIKAVVEAAEYTIKHPSANKEVQLIAKETAFDRIVEIIKEWSDAEH